MLSYIATAVLAAVGLLAASPEAPQWQASYGKALQATKESDQPLLVVIDKPNSEDARVEPALLGDGSIQGESVDQLGQYQLCHVDATSEYGQKVAKVFQATTFPHVAIIDKTGSVILARKTGKIDAASWEKLLDEHKDGVRAVSHVTYKPASDGVTYEGTGDYSNKPYCPSCQARKM
jgi:hypothetical protein